MYFNICIPIGRLDLQINPIHSLDFVYAPFSIHNSHKETLRSGF